MSEIDRFKEWAALYPVERRSGEWECNYDYWLAIYGAFTDFVDAKPFEQWTDGELQAVLYALARDNEIEQLAREILQRGEALVLSLAEASLSCDEPDARWQLADVIGKLPAPSTRVESMLLKFAEDSDEYVRRRALQSLAKFNSQATERIALAEWHRPHPHQQWARMNALSCLRRVRSNKYQLLLEEALVDPREVLSSFAAKLRDGEDT